MEDWKVELGHRVMKVVEVEDGSPYEMKGTVYQTFPDPTHVNVLWDYIDMSKELTEDLEWAEPAKPLHYESIEEVNTMLGGFAAAGQYPLESHTHIIVGHGEHTRTFIKQPYGTDIFYEVKPYVEDTTKHTFTR